MLSTTSQAKMRQNLSKDEKKANLKGLCENLERLLETKEEEGKAGKVEVVEDLVCEVEHLVIGQIEFCVHQVAGGRYTRWQVQQVAAKENREKAVLAPAASSKDCCCRSRWEDMGHKYLLALCNKVSKKPSSCQNFYLRPG